MSELRATAKVTVTLEIDLSSYSWESDLTIKEIQKIAHEKALQMLNRALEHEPILNEESHNEDIRRMKIIKVSPSITTVTSVR